jgi:hypothetical protein
LQYLQYALCSFNLLLHDHLNFFFNFRLYLCVLFFADFSWEFLFNGVIKDFCFLDEDECEDDDVDEFKFEEDEDSKVDLVLFGLFLFSFS